MQKSYYFQHDYNAANDHKILFLRQQFGIEGYGIYFYILEQLAQSKGRLPLKIVPVLAMQIQTTADKVNAVIKNYDLFDIDTNQCFFSHRLLSQLNFRIQLSEYGKRGVLVREANRGALRGASSEASSKGKERKGKKKEYTYPSLDAVVEYFKINGYKESVAKTAFDYYTAGDWKDSKGNRVISWKQKMRGVWFKDENREGRKDTPTPQKTKTVDLFGEV